MYSTVCINILPVVAKNVVKDVAKVAVDTANLDKLMQKSGLWRASSINCEFRQGLSSGFPKLDSYLPGSGWPVAGVTEMLYEKLGIGELRLLAPALSRLSKEQSRHILWVSPPYIPYPPALHTLGIDLTTILVVRPRTEKDMLWVLEQALGSNSCSVVLAWTDRMLDKQLRRLQVASKEGNTWNILFRPERNIGQSSPAELRIRLTAGQFSPLDPHSSINLKIMKRRGGWETDVIRIDLKDNLCQQTPNFSELIIPARKIQHDTKALRRPVAMPLLSAVTG